MPLCSFCKYVRSHIVRLRRHYIHFSKVLLFLLGLAVAHRLVKNSVLDVLMLYLTDDWGIPSSQIASAIINTEAAISGVIAFIIAILTQVWVGRYKMVRWTTASFILGLFLLWISALLPVEIIQNLVFYVALVLIAVGKAGKVPPFKDFIGDQISGNNEKQVEDRTTFWWRACRLTGAIISALVLSSMQWAKTFLICTAVMGATYILFLAGSVYYPYNYVLPPGKHPFFVLLKVLKAVFAKRSLGYPRTPFGYFLNQRNELPLFPCDPFLRWMDRAAIVEHGFEAEAELEEENLCTVEEVRQAKSLLRLFPLCLVFIVYGIVSAAGKTFFIEQSSGLDETIQINFFFIMQSALSYIFSYLANGLLSKYCSRNEMWKLYGVLVKVGVGIVASITCCEVASLVEHHRLSQVYIYGDPDTKDVDLHMSILWLTPQFILLGLMEGLAEDGLSELFDIFAHESTEGLDESFTEMILGFGKVLSVGCVFGFQRWFGVSINTSRLDKYYNMLMYFSLGSLAWYVLIGFYYVHIQKQETQFEYNHAPQEAAENEESEFIQELEQIINDEEFIQALEQVQNEDEDVIFSEEAELELDEMRQP